MIGHHLFDAVLACALLAGGLTSARWYARSLEDRYVHALAPGQFALKNQGTELQAAAFRQPDLLVVYGSSELEFTNPYHASRVFAEYPTGFNVFPIARGSLTCLVMLQDLASIGSELNGKQVVISVSPGWFSLHDRQPDYYMHNHSPLHLSALVFSTDLSTHTKQAAVRQLQQSPKLFADDRLLAFAADRLIDENPMSQAQYLAVLPLGKLKTSLMGLQDLWATYTYVASQPTPDDVVRRHRDDINWSSLARAAETEQAADTNSNEFGFENSLWYEKYSRLVPQRRNAFSDAWYVDNLQHSAEFADLAILLGGLRELGAHPLLLSQPIPGKYYDYIGISGAARSEYYARLREVAANFDVPLVDFADHDADIYFVRDATSHLSRKGWTYYARAMDAFYHGTLDQLANTEWAAAAVLPGDTLGVAAPLR